MNFSPIDAVKGICRLSGSLIPADDSGCERSVPLPRCGTCKFLINCSEDGVGTCTGLKKEDWTYSALCAVTCEGYESNV